MACRKGELSEAGKNRKAAAAAAVPSPAIGDALLFATMCIIGMPVDVHAVDGSVYSGIFHTASVDKDYGIVLKKARIVKKGTLDVNVMSENLIDTLIVRSEDLVQVIAKGVLLPSNGIVGNAGNGNIGVAAGPNESRDKDAEIVRSYEYTCNKKQRNHKRFSGQREIDPSCNSTAKAENLTGRLETIKSVEIEEVNNVSADGRQVGNGSLGMQSDSCNNPEFQDERLTSEVRCTSQRVNSCEAPSIAVNIQEDTAQQNPKEASSVRSNAVEGRERSSLDENACTISSKPSISLASNPIGTKSGSCLKASSNPFLFIPKSSNANQTTKESKLNPGAKIFSPSMLHHRTVSPPAVPNGAGIFYMPDTYPTVAQEVDASSFTHSSLPIKLVPYNNVAVVHGGNDAAYSQPIIGQVVNRTQPVRFTNQYQNIQIAPAYVHPNPQNVTLGRVGPVVCMHPMSNDVQNGATFPPVATRPILTPMHLAKQQGNASAQALQLCMNSPNIGNGQPQYVLPSPIPISQPILPVLRPFAIPGSNGFLNTKYA